MGHLWGTSLIRIENLHYTFKISQNNFELIWIGDDWRPNHRKTSLHTITELQNRGMLVYTTNELTHPEYGEGWLI